MRALNLVMALILSATLAGCISAKPVETQTAVDDRPLLFFTYGGASIESKLEIFIDGLYMADASELIEDGKGLAVLPGTHIVQLREAGKTVFEEKVYIGSGTSKTIPISINR